MTMSPETKNSGKGVMCTKVLNEEKDLT